MRTTATEAPSAVRDERAPEPVIEAGIGELAALRDDLNAWANAGKVLLDRVADLIHDTRRR